MAYKRVLKYRAGWLFNIHKGTIILQLEGDIGWPDLGSFDPPEFHAIIDILRNEGPTYYDRDAHVLWTAEEPQGEGES